MFLLLFLACWFIDNYYCHHEISPFHYVVCHIKSCDFFYIFKSWTTTSTHWVLGLPNGWLGIDYLLSKFVQNISVICFSFTIQFLPYLTNYIVHESVFSRKFANQRYSLGHI